MMENEHLEAKNRLDEIKRVLADTDKSAPVPAGMLYVIGLTSIFLNFTMDLIFSTKSCTFDTQLLISVAVLVSASVVALFISRFFIHKENDKLDRVFSKNQRFVFSIYAIAMLVGTAVTMSVVVVGGWALIHFYWAIILGVSAYIFGFFTKRLLSRFGLFLIFVSVVQIIGAVLYVKSIVPSPCEAGSAILPIYEKVYNFGLYSSTIIVGLGHIVMGYILGKSKNV